MLKKTMLAIVLGLVATADAQVNWPAITQQAKPWARWWWEGSAVDRKNITSNLEDYKAVGLGGMELTPIYGVHGYEKQFIDFLSPQWMQMLDHTLKEAKRVGLGMDLANGTGWPFGGPTTTDKDASKTIVHKSYTVNAGKSLPDSISYQQKAYVRTANADNKPAMAEEINPDIGNNKNLQELALDQVKFPGELPLILLMAYSNKGGAVDLTSKVSKAGKLDWTAPANAGQWTLYAMFEGLHGKMVERAAPGGEGYAIDHFSVEAVRNYFKRFDEAFKGHDISYIRALFNDSYEVDDANGQSNWTPKFLGEFQKRRGYDLKKHLPALFGKAGDEMNSRVLYDYRETISDLILDYFTREWKKWGTAKGAIIRNQSHGSPANLLDLYGAIDIPETEGDDILRYKFATSAAHVLGKPLASSESATWLNEHFLSSWGDVKKAVDLFLLGGVNHVFYHGVEYSPKEEQWPGWLFYAAVHFQQTNPQWKDFHQLNEYIARVQSFLQKGTPHNDILMYYPLADRYSVPEKTLLQHFDGMGREFEGTDFEKISMRMQERGYSFDFFSDRQLQQFTPSGSRIMTGGNSYQAILLPANKFITAASFQKLVALATNGAHILVYKNLPSDVPGFATLEATRNVFNKLVSQLKFIDNGRVKKALVGKGSFTIANDIETLLVAGGIKREIMYEKGLQSVKRKNIDGFTYFINNRADKAVSEWVPVNEKAVSVAMFNGMTGEAGLAKWRAAANGTIEVFLQLAPYESVIIQMFNTKKTGTAYPYLESAGNQVNLQLDWTVSFMSGGPSIPATFKTRTLSSWTEREADEYKYFSGTAKYAAVFTKPAGSAAAWQLDLGKVNETAEVVLNGKRIATLLGPQFKVVIPASALLATNTLEVIVSNLMANRIIYMDKNNLPWKKFYNTNMPARKKENAKNGLFNASTWAPLPSGLAGPVSLAPVHYATNDVAGN